MEEQIKELTLLLAYLTSWDEKDRLLKQEFKKSWKGYDFKTINKLDEEEYIYQENKHKYFIWKERGIEEAKRLMKKYKIDITHNPKVVSSSLTPRNHKFY